MMGGGMMMGGGGDVMGVLMNPEARTALGITDAQIQKFQEAGQAMFASMPRPQQGQMPDPAQMREQFQKMQAEGRKNLESILSADQVTRFDVMVFQRSGGLNSPDPASGGRGGPGGGFGFGGGIISVESLRALGLTEDQKKKVQEAQDKAMEAMMRPPQGFNFQTATEEERQAQFERMVEVGRQAREELRTAVKGFLTDAQKAKAEELMTDVPQFLQPPAGGPGGRPGGRSGGNLDNFQPGSGVPGQNPNREQQAPRPNNNAPRGRAFNT